jgi:hypothetical protein
VTYKTGFEFDDRIYWTCTQLVTTFHKSLSSTGHSRLLTTLHSSTALVLFLLENELRVESSLMLRPTVSRSVSLGIKHPSGAYDQIFITVRHLRAC